MGPKCAMCVHRLLQARGGVVSGNGDLFAAGIHPAGQWHGGARCIQRE